MSPSNPAPPPPAPFVRPLYPPGTRRHSGPGDDVLALKRGLWRAGYFDGPAGGFDKHYNQKAADAVRKFQRHAHIQPSGNVGGATWEALRTTHKEGDAAEWAFDDQAVMLAARAAAKLEETPAERAQRLGVDAANYWILHRDESRYGQVRPMPLDKPPDVPRVTDCSGHVTTVYFAAGAPDPNGRGYDGQGYTGTLIQQGRTVSPYACELLDLVFYGFTTRPGPAFPYGAPTHVAVYVGGGYVSSDGSDSGPQKRDLWYRPGRASATNPMGLHSVRRYKLA